MRRDWCSETAGELNKATASASCGDPRITWSSFYKTSHSAEKRGMGAPCAMIFGLGKKLRKLAGDSGTDFVDVADGIVIAGSFGGGCGFGQHLARAFWIFVVSGD
jgi:hypothetical protein